MANNRTNSKQTSAKMAFCGLMVALSSALMLASGFVPVLTYCSPMVAGVLLLPILLEYGKKTAWTAYAAISLITLFLGMDKEASFFFLFLGYYPILKWDIDRLKSKAMRVGLKLLIFNVSIAAMYVILGLFLRMDALVEEFTQMGTVLLILFCLLLNVCMFLYDRLLSPIVWIYVHRVRPRLKIQKRR